MRALLMFLVFSRFSLQLLQEVARRHDFYFNSAIRRYAKRLQVMPQFVTKLRAQVSGC